MSTAYTAMNGRALGQGMLIIFINNGIIHTKVCINMEIYMANATLVQLKVDSEIKEDVSRIYENLGLDLPTAIRIFFKKSIAVGGLPFELREENTRWKIYDQVRKSIQENNVPEMSLEEINAEIAETRKQVFDK